MLVHGRSDRLLQSGFRSLVDLQKGSANEVTDRDQQMATIDWSTQLLHFLRQYWEYRHIARHTVSIDKVRQRVLLTMDGLQTAALK